MDEAADQRLSPPQTPTEVIVSPFQDDEEQDEPTHDYSQQLDQVLGNGDAEEDEDDYGEFVYSGVDVERPQEDQEDGYNEQMAELLGRTHTPTEPLASTSILTNGSFAHVPPIPVCRRQTQTRSS